MTVGSVSNSNNNADLYAAGAAAVGAGAGVATGYLTKPFLKDGAPTDAFIKKMGENLQEIMSPEEKEIAQSVDNGINEVKNSITNAKSIDELKEVIVKNSLNGMTDEVLDFMKESDDMLKQVFTGMGVAEKDLAKFSEAVKEANSVDEFKNIIGNFFDKEYAGKTLEEIKNTELGAFKSLEKNSAKATFEQFWDSSKKAFVNCEEGAGKAIKKAAQSIQGKYAAIYGAIGAGVLGLATLLLCGGKKEAAPENIEA